MIAEPVLNAVLNLFAMAASRLDAAGRESARARVLGYLRHHVGLSDTDTYIGLYDHLLEVQETQDDEALLAAADVVANRLKPLLHGIEKIAALVRFWELASVSPEADVPRRIASRLSGALGLDPDVADGIRSFLADPESVSQGDERCRLLGGGEREEFRGRVAAYRLPDDAVFLVQSVGSESIRLDGAPMERGRALPLRAGHVLRDPWGNELYHSHVAAAFGGKVASGPGIVFEGERLDYRFPGSDSGLHDLSFAEHGGRLVAIMGGSGAGKSTLMGILNGSICPDSGRLLLNGHDVHQESGAVEGVIGFVPQDDLLFEDLTVFQNLYYAARLCMSHLPKDELARRVRTLLDDLGQADAADLRVGSPLQKTISGGQRKRLNVALELIREPTVLFVDEPTSGLSSADSEVVMSLLREQAARGKLVFVVIHQPSSNLFRSFDALWVLDQGGWPIFQGTPLEAMTYFRSRASLPDAGEPICTQCGGVQPEQILEIVEAKTLDEGGRPGRERRISPADWNRLFRQYAEEKARARPAAAPSARPSPPLENNLHRPGWWGQTRLFLSRDVTARLANRSYMAVALLEPLVLGALVGWVSRGAFGGTYSFHDNQNLHVFFFMGVIAALFLGLSVSAEEICRDGRVLRRERFLHLSWWSYIHAKAIYLAGVAAIQMLLYATVATRFVELPGMLAPTWGMLFACAFCSSLLGLNISASFRSAVTIYVLIPLVLIPQMLLCGVVIPYDDLIAAHTARREVPRYANLLPPRWGYEGLVVHQYANNAYTRPLFAADAAVRLAEHELDYVVPELQGLLQSISLLREQGETDQAQTRLGILGQEMARLAERAGMKEGPPPVGTALDEFDAVAASRLRDWLAVCRRRLFDLRREAAAERKAIETGLEQEHGREEMERMRRRHVNRAIQDQALNLRDMKPVGLARDGLYHKTLPMYRLPESRWGEAHFLAGHKRVWRWTVPTYAFNLLMVLGLSAVCYLALGFRLLPRALRRPA